MENISGKDGWSQLNYITSKLATSCSQGVWHMFPRGVLFSSADDVGGLRSLFSGGLRRGVCGAEGAAIENFREIEKIVKKNAIKSD